MCTPHKIIVSGLQIRERKKKVKVLRFFKAAWNILIIFLYADIYLQVLTNDIVKRDFFLNSALLRCNRPSQFILYRLHVYWTMAQTASSLSIK